MQASTAQRSPEATCRPWCAHDWAGAEGTVRGEGPLPIPHTGSRSRLPPPRPQPISLARTLASLTAPASLPHLRPAVGAGEGLALFQVALHAAPLRTDAMALGTSGRVWSPWPHTLGALLDQGLGREPPLSLHLQLPALTQGCPEGAPFSDYLEDPIFSGPVTRSSSLYPSLRSSTLTLPPPAHTAGASDTVVAGVPPALSICHSPALSFHHTF